MHETAAEAIGTLTARVVDPRLRRLKGTCRFDVEDTGSWRLSFDEGGVRIAEGPGEADCAVSCREEDLVRAIRGEQNLITAFMQGRLRIRGDYGLFRQLHQFLRLRPPPATPLAATERPVEPP